MSWKGDLIKAGILANGNDINLIRGSILLNGSDALVDGKVAGVVTKTAAYTATVSDMIDSRIFKITPTAGINLTTPTAAELIAGMPNYAVGTNWTITVVNLAAATHAVTLVGGTNVTIVGNDAVDAATSGSFKVVIASATTINIYRM